jgi:hypothetical protein
VLLEEGGGSLLTAGAEVGGNLVETLLGYRFKSVCWSYSGYNLQPPEAKYSVEYMAIGYHMNSTYR